MMRAKGMPVWVEQFLSFSLLTAILTGGLIWINLNYSDILYETVEEAAMQELKKSADTFEIRLYELQQVAMGIARESSVEAIAARDEMSIKEYAKLNELEKNVDIRFRTNPMIERLIIYFPFSSSAWVDDAFWNAQQVVASGKHYQLSGERMDNYFAKLAQAGRFFSLEYITLFSNGKSQEQMSAAFDLYPLSNFKVHAYVSFGLDMEYVAQLFSFAHTKSGGLFELTYKSGETLFSLKDAGIDASYGGKGMISYSYSPDGSDFTYRLTIPSANISGSVLMGMRTSLSISLLAVLLSFGLSYLVAQRNARPVTQLVELIRPDQPAKNEFHLLHDSISKLLQDRGRLEERVRQQLEIQRNAVFSKLLSYGYRSDEEALKALTQVEIMPESGEYSAVYIRFIPQDGMEEMLVHVMLNEWLLTSVPDTLFVHSLHNRTYALLCRIDEERPVNVLKGQLEDALSAMKREFKFKFDVTCVIGLPKRALLEWAESLKSARRTYHALDTAANNLVLLAEEEPDAKTYAWKLPDITRHQLIGLCQAGDFDMIKEVVSQFFKEQGARCVPDKLELAQLCYDFRSLLLSLMSQTTRFFPEEVAFFIDSLPNATSAQLLEQDILSIFEKLCRQLTLQRESGAHQSFIEIREYIQAHYTDQNLGLSSIAEAFNLNEKYLSQLYKKEGGVNLGAEIENLRLKHATDLMANTGMPLAEICVACGYGSLNSFYKAFKRVYALSPSSYRKNLKNS